MRGERLRSADRFRQPVAVQFRKLGKGTTMEPPSWLACKVAKGLFPDEVAVVVATADGQRISFFMPLSRVRFAGGRTVVPDDEVEAQVPVEVIDRNDFFGLVSLPGDPLEGSRVAKVAASLLAMP